MYDAIKRHRNFYKTTFSNDNRDDDHINRTDVTIRLADIVVRRYKQWYIKVRCKYEVYFYFTGAMCQTSDFLLLEGSSSTSHAKTRSTANSFSICYRRYNVPISPEST